MTAAEQTTGSYYTPLAEVCRGDTVESIHYGAVAVMDHAGRLLHWAGDPDVTMFSRSTLKPFQALPLMAHPNFDSLGFDYGDIAMTCASHSGESFHVERVRSLLERNDLTEDDLACGTHAPFYHEALGSQPQPGERFSPLQHNCSGKHAGMLILAQLLEAPLADYLDHEHAVQIAIMSAVAHCTGVMAGELIRATDGCSAPNYAMPLSRLARAYAWLARPPEGDPFAEAANLIRTGMLAHPELVAGTRRLDTRLMNTLPHVLSKSGAEAVHCLALPDKGLGIAIKIADGNSRALGCIVIAILQQLNILDSTQGLEDLAEIPLHNARDYRVGSIRPVIRLEQA